MVYTFNTYTGTEKLFFSNFSVFERIQIWSSLKGVCFGLVFGFGFRSICFWGFCFLFSLLFFCFVLAWLHFRIGGVFLILVF